MFARRGYSIQSLAVGPSEREGMSRICMVVPGTDESIAKLFKQLSKLVYVFALADLTNTPFVNRELLLVKVGVWGGEGGRARRLWLAPVYEKSTTVPVEVKALGAR